MNTNLDTFLDDSRTYGPAGKPHYDMVDFYYESRRRYVNENTNNLCRTRLNTVLCDWEENWNVVVQKEQIIGLTGIVLQRWSNEFSKTHKPSSMNNYISFLNGFLDWAYKMSFVQENFSYVIKSQKIPDIESIPEDERPQEKFYSNEQIQKLFKTIEEREDSEWIRDEALVSLFLYSGLRREEVAKLTIKSVLNYGRGKIYCQRKGGAWKLVEVNEEWYKYLDKYLEVRQPYSDNDPLFITNRGTGLTKRGMYDVLRKYQDAAELDIRGSHVFRHVFISEVEKAGGIAVARDCANHKHIRITDRYDHTTADQRQVAVNSLKFGIE